MLKSKSPKTTKMEQDYIMMANDVVRECLKLMVERRAMYGDSWKSVRHVTSFIDYIVMKLDRVFKLAEKPRNQKKIEDQLKDTINYCIFAILWLRQKKEVCLNECETNKASNYSTSTASWLNAW